MENEQTAAIIFDKQRYCQPLRSRVNTGSSDIVIILNQQAYLIELDENENSGAAWGHGVGRHQMRIIIIMGPSIFVFY